MSRKRIISPEFWEDETIGALSLGARLLFIGSWNLADDEGLLRFNPAYLKSTLFMYDNPVTVDDVARFMDELVRSGIVAAFTAGQTQQTYAQIKNFLKWQRIDKPQKSKLPKLTDPDARIVDSRNHSENGSANEPTNTSRLREEKRSKEKGNEVPSPPEEKPPAKQYGNPEVNLLIAALKDAMGLAALDGTVDKNRFAANGAIKKIAQTAGSRERAAQLLEHAIRSAAGDKWHSTRMTGMKYVEDNANKLVLQFPLPG
jgi:hypothetical protein